MISLAQIYNQLACETRKRPKKVNFFQFLENRFFLVDLPSRGYFSVHPAVAGGDLNKPRGQLDDPEDDSSQTIHQFLCSFDF